jgi:diacylglycerol kinase (ATP)
MVATVILNPYSARWRAAKRQAEVSAALEAAGLRHAIHPTTGPGHAEELASQAARAGRLPVLVAGGDGTIGEVVNGLLQAHPQGVLGPLGILPLGTANDLAHNLGLPLDLPGAARAAARGNTRRIDLGRANEWAFANNSAVGLEPVVSLHNMRIVRLRGVIRYLVAALRAIGDKPEWTMQLQWDDGSYRGPVSLVSVGNCPLTGGLFRMAPAADPADGRLTFVYGYARTRRKMLSLLPRAISGAYVNDPAVHQHHTRRLVIEAEPETPIQVDGEVRGTALGRVVYEVLPSRLDVLVP